MIGRATELAAIEAGLDELESGSTALRIVGPAGSGKSTLVDAAIERAAARSWQVLACRPTRAESDLSFAALGDLLEPVVAELPPAPADPQRRALRVALLLDDPDDGPINRLAVGLGLRSVLRRAAEASPVVVVVDDGHWLDGPSADALAIAMRRLAGDRCGWLVAVRPLDDPAGVRDPGPWVRTFPALEIEVGPLDLRDLHELLRDRLGLALPRPTLQRIHEVSGGNPLYALEIARMVATDGAGHAGITVPPRIMEAVEGRLRELTPAAREALLVAAAMADPRLDDVIDVAGEAGVDEAVSAGLLVVEGERVRTAHPLYGSAAYAAAGPAHRRHVHRRLAGTAIDLEERARHLALGTGTPDEATAAIVADAARMAARRGAPANAATLAERAADLSPGAPDRVRRRTEAAAFHATAGDIGRARAILDELIPTLAPGDARAEALLILADTKGNDAAAVELCRCAATEARDPILLARIHQLLGSLLVAHAEVEAGLASLRAAVEHAERGRSDDVRIRCLVDLSRCAFWVGQPVEGALETAQRLVDRGGRVPARDSPAAERGLQALCRDDLASARRFLRAEIERAAAEGDENSRAFLLCHMAEVEYRADRWPEAAAAVEDALVATEQAGIDSQGTMALWVKAFVVAHLGRLDEARATATDGQRLAEAMRDPVFIHNNRSVLGFIALGTGDVRAADALLRPYLAWLAGLGWAEPAAYDVWPDAIEAMIGLGDLDAAAAELARFEARAATFVGAWAPPRIERCRGLLAAARGNLDLAIRTLTLAVPLHAAETRTFEAGRSSMALGIVLRRARHRGAARDAFEAAIATFDRLGATAWAASADLELQRIGGRRRGGMELTEAEARIAALVADGRTNREVAAALYITERTVEWNLSKVYSKLDVRSRAELAARFARRIED